MDITPSEASYQLFIGIDIAAQTARIAIYSPQSVELDGFTIRQTAAGMETFHKRLLTHHADPHQVRVVMEATSNYWLKLAGFLHDKGYPVSVINPVQANRFAQAILQNAKTDLLDAQNLAQLGIKLNPRLWHPSSAIREELFQRLLQRSTLVEMKRAGKNRKHALKYRPLICPPIGERNEKLVKFINCQIADIEVELRALLDQDPEWKAVSMLLLNIPCVGLVTVCWTMVMTDNFALCDNPEELVSYAGLAPYARQSGTSLNSYRRVAGKGCGRLRQALYLSVLIAIRHQAPIAAFYYRLVARGKPGKVALIAASRKLLRIMWAVATHRQPFDVSLLPPMPVNIPAKSPIHPTLLVDAIDNEVLPDFITEN